MASETGGTDAVHYPAFIVEPGSADVLFIVVVVFMLFLIFVIGAFYFRLHALPEQMAHTKHPVQYQLVAILALIALFTHNNAFWIAALLVAAISLPDFITPIRSMATSLQKLSGSEALAARPTADANRENRAAVGDFVDRDSWEGREDDKNV
ncbi:hypothetical protein [Tropicimonas marinistellae]|uniref:hypothetical protein n=1 Tax=Tropicimonas marinistellae TaxID=1739787 RepID=UPI00122E36B7|nr:hypothetical protein [Tropicimonas marinistellae]